MNAIENSRAEFEEFISSSPFGYSTDRYFASAGFPDTYKNLRVDLAWNAWCESRKEIVTLLESNSELHSDCLAAIAEVERLRAQVSMFEATTKHQDDLLVTMKGECDKLRARLTALKSICGRFSNIAYNLHQLDRPVSQNDKRALKDLQVEYDELQRANQIEGGG